MPGSGKTQHVEALTASAFRVGYFSPVPDYFREGRLWCTIDYLERWRGLLDDPHARIVLDVEDAEGADLAELHGRFFRLLREATKRKGGRPFVFVNDEVGDYKEWAEDTLLSMFRRARHNRMAVIMASQCATDIPFRCRKMASRVACFEQEHARELAELGAVYPEEFVERVRAWSPGAPPAEWRSRSFLGRWTDTPIRRVA